MKFSIIKSDYSGTINVPGSKSHTIRACVFASIADGESTITDYLVSSDAESCLNACKKLGAAVEVMDNQLKIKGLSGRLDNLDTIIDTGNSGTTIRIVTGIASLAKNSKIQLTGDEQIQSRPIQELLNSLNRLGGNAYTLRNNGCPPLIIDKPISGGYTDVISPTSQFLTSLLVCTPFAENDTELNVTQLNEKPYVDITLWWMDRLGIKYDREGYEKFFIPGKQKLSGFKERIPADFSSATFFAVAAAVSGGTIELKGLDFSDPQGDKLVFEILEDMGAEVIRSSEGVFVKGNKLRGGEYDLNSIPDALPALAVAACAAEGESRLANVPQARLKETDRISVMAAELSRMGADIRELPDGLVINGSDLKGAPIEGHRDHRVIMALTIAGSIADGQTFISTAEAVNITFPDFPVLMKKCGARLEIID